MEYVKNDTKILEIISEYPETIDIFERYNMMCKDCMGASEETVLEGAIMHSVCPVSLIGELNNLIKKRKEN